MKVDGTDWRMVQRTKTPFDKYTPQLHPYGGNIYYVWEESDGKHRQIWTAVTTMDGTGWLPRKRTHSPYGKYDPQFQIVEDTIYYVWHEDHGRTEPIWVASEKVPRSSPGQRAAPQGDFEKELSMARKVATELFQDDRATGFRSGDVRGAISVKIPLGGGKK